MKAKLLAFLGWMLIALVVIVALAMGVPRLLGGTTLTVVTGSMQPAINPGDVVAVIPTDPDDLNDGDVVTFQPESDDPALITHRIISIDNTQSEPTFITRGDANTADDPEIVADQIQGRVMYTIPYLGWATTLAGPAMPVLVGIAAVLLLGVGAYAAFAPPRTPRSKETTQ
ncbi:signal peptidase I [Leucobacter sp. USHLN154]|uniref:signal peptidase I n=1 Tax=Leucobacter sp. USHLN154 TaxID=3081269 RepID=UPI00301B1A21